MFGTEVITMARTTDDARTAARKRLEERQGFIPHLLVYLLFNTGLIMVWVTSDPHGFFWPGVVLLLWGIGVVMHAWNAFFARPVTEDDVDRELDRRHTDSQQGHHAD